MMSVGGSVLLVVLATSCGPGLTAKSADSRDVAQVTLVDASNDVPKMRAMLADKVTIGGLWFTDPKCTGFTDGVVEGPRLDELARCLVGLHWVKSDRIDMIGDVTVLNSGVFELEARVVRDSTGRVWLAWIGFASRRDREVAPTITATALETLRVEGIRRISVAPGIERPARAWLRVCLDETGAVTTRTMSTSSADAAREFARTAAAWRFKPFAIEGQPVPVCASVHFEDPPAEKPEELPMPAPASMQGGEPVVLDDGAKLDGHRISGETAIAPDNGTINSIRHKRRRSVRGTFRYCVGTTGHVESVMPLQSTGYSAYDRALMQGISQWTFRPYEVDGVALPVCVPVTFIYKFDDYDTPMTTKPLRPAPPIR